MADLSWRPSTLCYPSAGPGILSRICGSDQHVGQADISSVCNIHAVFGFFIGKLSIDGSFDLAGFLQ